MGRSKFPGKPPKTVTRKRIKVLAWPEATQSDSVTVAENIYYGLSLFNETFGDNEKEHPPFHGFSSKEAKLSASYIKTQQHDGKNNPKDLSSSSDENLPSSSSIDEDIVKNAKTSSSVKENHKNDVQENKDPIKIEELEAKSTKVENSSEEETSSTKGNKNEKIEKFSNFVKTPVLKSVNNILDRHHRTRQLRNSTAKRLLQKAKSNNSNSRGQQVQSTDKSVNVRKFVLPIRSAHSSRVIKPNKRFIEELEEKSTTEHSENDVKQTKKAKKGKDDENSTNEKESRTKLKKSPSHSILSAQNSQSKCNEKTTHAQTMKISLKPHNSSKQKIQTGKNLNDVQSLASQCQKNNSIPIKVLPDVNIPNSESSRIQTRSGALNNASNSHIPSPKVPENVELTISSDDNNINCESNSVKNEKNIHDSDDITTNCKTDGDHFDSESSLSESGSDHGNNSEDEQSEWTGTKLSGGKVILRKARLKLDNKTLGGTEGPFSMANVQCGSNGSPNTGLTGTVKCGVCGAVRFYRFVKQARKFGIYSCESCRKFISKMIKRQACAKSTNNTLTCLQCHKGDGLCLVPPVVRSQQWNLMRCVYKARCPACWLKMCLKCYNIPPILRTGLNAMLPPLMRDPLTISLPLCLDVDSDLQNQKLIGCNMGWPNEDCLEKNLFKSAMNWNNMELGQKSNYHGSLGGFLTKKTDKFDYPASVSPIKKRKKENRIKVRKKMKNPSVVPTTFNKSQVASRQRVELKGPRVKHVCRSASVALGQPIATFPSPDGKDDVEVGKIALRGQKDGEKNDRKEEVTREKESNKSNQEGIICNINSNPQLQSRRGKNQNNLAANVSVERSLPKQIAETVHTVSIDFWEQYDPAQVGAKGFALIGSELFHIPAICFLCGSAGKEPLIHCQCCCEPYHIFCLEPSEWNACIQPNWCCPRCTVCQTCQLRSGTKLSCIRCRQSFHYSCFPKSGVSARLYSPDRPYVCQSCIKCKSCGSEGVSVYVGNLPLCSMCFKLRQRGNYCPLCQRCYNENDFDTKMMECNECSCWVHAHCEGLSDERYQILSYLPDTIEFTCRQCSSNPNSIWRNAIEAELKTGFIAVVKALGKNRKICAALQWSPRKECLCRPLPTIRKLDFDEKYDSCLTNRNSTINDDVEDSMTDKLAGESNASCSFKGELSRFSGDLDEQPADIPRRGLRRLRQKIHTKDCNGKMKNPSDSKEGNDQENANDCNCSEQQIITRPSPTLFLVKQKVNGNEYGSLSQFHCDMEHVINRIGASDLLEAYHNILKEIFPWFDTLSSSLEMNVFSTPSKEIGSDSPGLKLDSSILDAWKEEILRSPKTIAKMGNVYSNINVEDARSCFLCKGLGDGQELKEGRLLYCGQNEWVHSNCALWSNEVFEEIDGSLQNVHSTISRGRMIRCSECGKKGASIGCCSRNCSNTFHYSCARNVNMLFNDDKTVFCSLHADDCTSKKIQNENDFSLKRPVYVELDRKKKKFAEPDKVKVMIGSLTVDCLGTISPEFSDGVEKIIPSGYKCSRLYWSTVNPLKIVRYYIRTYVQVFVPEVSTDLENNVTIDHSIEQKIEEDLRIQKLELLAVKQTLDALIDTVCNKEVDENLAEQNNTDLLPPELKEAIFEDLPHDLLDGISMQDIFPKMSIEDFLVMDLKNDAFSTELLKDEMLPTDVEELKISESKASKTDTILDSNSQSDNWLESKNSDQDLIDDVFDSKSQRHDGKEVRRSKSEVLVGGQRNQRSCSLTWSCKLDSSYGPTKRRKVPRNCGLKSSDMSVETQNDHRTSMFHDLRIPDSIMVTVGRTSTSNIISESVRELKYCVDDTNSINCRLLPSKDEAKDHKNLLWHARQQPRIVQVDGPADASSASECSSPEYNLEERILPNCSSMPQLDGANDDTSQDSKLEARETETDPKDLLKSRLQRIFKFSEMESKKKFYEEETGTKNSKNAFCLKIPQLDGADDISSDDECPNPQINDVVSPSITDLIPEELGDQPVKCKRCQCTYRTVDSYNRHLANCDIMTTSDSDSETMDNKLASPDSTFSQSIGSMSPQFASMSPSEGHTLLSEYPDMQVTSPLEASVPSPHPNMQIEPIAQALISPQMHTHATVETVHQTVLTSNDMIVQTQYTRTTTTLPNSSVVPPESGVQITEIASPDPITDSNSTMDTSSNVVASNFSPPNVQNVVSREIIPTQAVKAPKVKSPRAPKPRTKSIRAPIVRNSGQPTTMGNVRCQAIQNNPQMIQLQQSQRQTTAAPTVILQQVAPQSLMSAYVETLQQQSGQNLQYIAAIGGQHETAFKPQFIATNQLVPGSYIQTTPDNLLALQNGGISVLPSVQLAQPQPTVLGTIIQQQPSAIQCGVISSEQLVLSSTPTLEMFTDSTGSMFVSSQPMYYGLETIVSNTVMSSSQFVTGTVPQVLASSYQTTTQVFQASKLMEPIVDVQAVSAMPNVPTVQAVQGVPGMAGSYVVVNQPPPLTEAISTPQLNVSNPEANFTPAACTLSSAIAPQTVESVRPIQTLDQIPNLDSQSVRPIHNLEASSIRPIHTLEASSVRPIQTIETPLVDIQNHSLKPMQQAIPTIPRVAVRPNPSMQLNPPESTTEPWKLTEPILASEQPISNSIRPYFDSKHVSQNTSMIKSSISSKIPPLHNHCITHRNIVNKCNHHDVNSVHSNYSSSLTNTNCNNLTLQNSPVMTIPSAQNKITMPTHNARPMNRVLPMQAVTKLDSTKSNQKSDIPLEEPTKPEIKFIETEIVLPPKDISPVIKPEIKLKINNLEMIVNQTTNDNFKLLEEFEENNREIYKENLKETAVLENVMISLKESVKENLNENVNERNSPKMELMKETLKDSLKDSLKDTLSDSLKDSLKDTLKDSLKDSLKSTNEITTENLKLKSTSILINDNIKETIKENARETIKEIKENVRESIKEIKEYVRENIKEMKGTIKEIAKVNMKEIAKENIKESMKIKESKREKDNLKKESIKENLKNQKNDLEPKEKSPSSLKIVLQKQLQDGSYKITHNLTTKKSPQQPQNQLQLLPIKTFTLKTNTALSEKTSTNNNNNSVNLMKLKTPPIAVKKPRLASKGIKNMKTGAAGGAGAKAPIVPQKKKLTGPSLMYEIKSQDGFTHTASSMTEVWETVFQAVQNARKAHNLPPLPHNPLTENLGLENNACVYLVEQLPGVNRCTKYKPKFHNLTPPKPGEGDGDLLTECINGAARAEPFKERKVHDVFSWLASRHRQQPKLIAITENESRRAASTNLPMAMRFRILKETSKESVGVYHSHIHGRGLFCLRDIEAGEMVIEYAGEVIRASLTDKREKYYDSKNIGCYMFKIDDHLVVDATMKGNAARFINHSCEPNCYSRVVDILGKKHILIFALRRIVQGEELTYDYKFPFEDIKIPCTCGSRRCRKYLN